MHTQIHRLLDDAFAGVDMTTDAQDLKEEIRANLLVRVSELIATGSRPDEADEQAIKELGDIRELLAVEAESGDATESALKRPVPPPAPASMIELVRSHRVRPKPGFVIRAVLWSTLALAALALATLSATHALPLPLGPTIALVGVAATGVGLLVDDALTQETTTNHPMPELRAGCYALSSGLALFGLGLAGLVALDVLPPWCLAFAVLGVVAAIGGFVILGVTQTNRHKAWTFASRAGLPANRFEAEPEAAARFGIYTAAIWLMTLVAAVALGFTAGWWWAPLPIVAGLAVTLLVLARMLFGSRPEPAPRDGPAGTPQQ